MTIKPFANKDKTVSFDDTSFSTEALFENILSWGIFSQVLFILFVPFGAIIWAIGAVNKILATSKEIDIARKKLQEQGFYEEGLKGNFIDNNDDGRFREEALETPPPKDVDKRNAKYLATIVNVYPSKVMLNKLIAASTLIRIFIDANRNSNGNIKPNQLVPYIKKLGFIVDLEAKKPFSADPECQSKRDTIEHLGYGNRDLLEHMHSLLTTLSGFLSEFNKAMEDIKKKRNDTSIVDKVKALFKSKEEKEKAAIDQAAYKLVTQAFELVVAETDVLYKQIYTVMEAACKQY